MLLDNYKPLLSFNKGKTFKNVLGNTVDVKTVLGGQGLNGKTTEYSTGTYSTITYTASSPRTWVLNNHEYRASVSSFNYDATNATNSYTKETTSYNWDGVVSTAVNSSSDPIPNLLYNGFVLFVGTGETETAATDYKLANAIELSVTGASCTHNANGKTYVQRTFTNATGADVTIKEIGCYLFASNVNGKNATPIPIVMIGRTVLETPVTIANGDSQTFTYVLENEYSPSGTLSITANGTYNVLDYVEVNVNILGAPKYGADGGTFLGSPDANGEYQQPTGSYNLSFDGIVKILDDTNNFGSLFKGNQAVVSVTFPDLTTLGDYVMDETFSSCHSLVSASFPALRTIGEYCFNDCFGDCTSLEEISFPAITTSTLGTGALYSIIPATDGVTLHFPSNFESIFTDTSVFGGENTVVLFDLPATE